MCPKRMQQQRELLEELHSSKVKRRIIIDCLFKAPPPPPICIIPSLLYGKSSSYYFLSHSTLSIWSSGGLSDSGIIDQTLFFCVVFVSQGVSAVGTLNAPFRKSASFSTPISERMDEIELPLDDSDNMSEYDIAL